MLAIRILDIISFLCFAIFLLFAGEFIAFDRRSAQQIAAVCIIAGPVLLGVRYGIISFTGMENPFFKIVFSRIFIYLTLLGLVIIGIRADIREKPEPDHFAYVLALYGIGVFSSFLYTKRMKLKHKLKPEIKLTKKDRYYSIGVHIMGALVVGMYIYKIYFYPEEFHRSYWWIDEDNNPESWFVRNYAYIFVIWFVFKILVGKLIGAKDFLEDKKPSRFFYGVSIVVYAGLLLIDVLSPGPEARLITVGAGGYCIALILYLVIPKIEGNSDDILDAEDLEIE